MVTVNETMPNKPPEPTAVGAVGHRATVSAIAVHAASGRWLSFLL
jgi:hypothetical protein